MAHAAHGYTLGKHVVNEGSPLARSPRRSVSSGFGMSAVPVCLSALPDTSLGQRGDRHIYACDFSRYVAIRGDVTRCVSLACLSPLRKDLQNSGFAPL